MIGWAGSLSGLAKPSHVTHGGNRPPAIIVTFQRPGRTSRLVDGGIQDEIGFHIPFQVLQHRSNTSEPFFKARAVPHKIQKHVPMTGWSFGTRTVGPKFRQNSRKVSAFDEIGWIRKPRRGIYGVAGSVIGPQGVISKSPRRDIDQPPVVRSGFAAAAGVLPH